MSHAELHHSKPELQDLPEWAVESHTCALWASIGCLLNHRCRYLTPHHAQGLCRGDGSLPTAGHMVSRWTSLQNKLEDGDSSALVSWPEQYSPQPLDADLLFIRREP